MQLPLTKLTAGLVAVVSGSKLTCSTNACLQAIFRNARHVSPIARRSFVEGANFGDGLSPKYLSVLKDIRGGASGNAATNGLIDFSRESLHLQGMGTYGTITALILNASLRLFTSTKFSKDQHRLVRNSFNIATALCIISGVFTAILFQLMTIYSKSALGMSNDVGYLAFKDATHTFRLWGFRCFLTEMWAFVMSFMVHLFNTLWTSARQQDCDTLLSRTGQCIFGGSMVLVLTGVFFIRSVLKLASKYIYST